MSKNFWCNTADLDFLSYQLPAWIRDGGEKMSKKIKLILDPLKIYIFI